MTKEEMLAGKETKETGEGGGGEGEGYVGKKGDWSGVELEKGSFGFGEEGEEGGEGGRLSNGK